MQKTRLTFHRTAASRARAGVESTHTDEGLRYSRRIASRWTRRAAAPPTVYRVLDFLLDAGLVHRIELLSAYVGCGGPGKPHISQFLICHQCNAVAEIDALAIAQALTQNAKRPGFRADTQTIEIKGLCSECSVSA